MFFERQRMFHKRDRLRQLRAFSRAARLESITKAAESLGISQPAVSLHVRELENELEAILFDRSGPRISLTHAGRCLYEFAEPLVKGMDSLSVNFMELLDDQVTGHVHMAASHTGVTLVLPPFFKRFRDRYPGVTLRVRSCQIVDGMKLLFGDEVEFAFGVGDSYAQDELDFHEITTYQMVLIAAKDHPLAGREAVSPHEGSRLARDHSDSRHVRQAVRGHRHAAIRNRRQGRDRGRRMGRDQALRRSGARDCCRAQPLCGRLRQPVGHFARKISPRAGATGSSRDAESS